MNLTLEVVSANGSSLGAGRSKTFGSAGGTIGRATDCDWVLPSPNKYVSRHHATVLCANGTYYIKAEGQNEVSINDPNVRLVCGKPSPIRHRDRVFIDEYEILANLVSESARAPALIGDPFADDEAPASLIPMADPFDGLNLDPLSQLPSLPEKPGARDRNYSGPPQGDVLSDPLIIPANFESASPVPPDPRPRQAIPTPSRPAPRPSAPAPAAAPPSAPKFQPIPINPDAWDKTTYGHAPQQIPEEPVPVRPAFTPPPVEPARRPVSPPPQAMPPNARPSVSPTPAAPPQAMPPNVRPSVSPTPAAPPQAMPPNVRPSVSPTPVAPPVPPPVSPARLEPRVSNAAPVSAPAPGGADLNSLLRAAGVDPDNVDPEIADTLGQIFKMVVQGTIDALRARDEVKTQFRLAVTRVRTKENNPLAFSVDAADAIHSMLVRRNPAFLAPVEAFQRAFDDIRAHQMAMIAGMRAGFESLMGQFDPEELRERFDKQVKRGGLLGAVAKPNYWDQYGDYFSGLRGDRDDAFRRLFGEEFALAYEKQIALLKRGGQKSP
jgi:type VI secretion system FHA domain protein